MSYRVAEVVVESILKHGVDRVYSVPGESFLPVLDALVDEPRLDLVTCRHEGSAGLAAIADAKLTGTPGVFFVSRGPGAFNAGIALHVAQQEAIPLVMFIGQVDTPNLGRDAVQEIDASRAFNGTLKWAGKLTRPEQTNEVLARAFAVASSGTPGPVAVELPEDVLFLPANQTVATIPHAAVATCPAETAKACARLLASAKRPLLLVGGECRSAEFRADLQQLSETWNLPVVATNKGQDQFSNAHANWAGQFGFFPNESHLKLFSQADLVIALGTRLGDVSTLGFAFPKQDGTQKLIHIYPDANQIGKQFPADIGVVSGSHSFVSSMLQQLPAGSMEQSWREEIQTTQSELLQWLPEQIPDGDTMGHTITALAQHLMNDAIVTTDSGNFAGWVHRIFALGIHNRLLGSACGAMGTGVPSGLAAALRYPERQVLAFCGDGGFLMNGNELATAVERDANLKVIVSNNRSYGTIRTHQQRTFPRRVLGTDLTNPDFVKLAEAFGAKGFLVTDSKDASRVVSEAMATVGPVLIEIRCDVEQGLNKSLAAMR
ncbi:thiamine pyrophosphate-dependent enzyme [Comamonas sp.]|uniref:thiamine pyrophosphate-dependent enzyme n=1 Tax=Comamonas sp. TaxID=34028 RepID=UPI0028A1BF6D|nr:thiamine pyrophosphate-dependent enzyme [Comamonas sp.]